MKPLDQMPAADLQRVRGVFTDIDDTITTEGALPASAYAALEQLTNSGLAVVPITGRPAGWCDMVARFWPVAGVVGENGAFYFSYDRQAKRMRRRYIQSAAERAQGRADLKRIEQRVLAEVPGTAVASDQAYRESDLAIDFAEDVPHLPAQAVERIVQIYEEEGATAKVSSIHVNGWFGNYNKLAMTRVFASEVMNVDLDAQKAAFIYCGDSPNDAPMFAYFPNACGVANVRDFESRIEALPAYISSQRGADGFVQIASAILTARQDSASKNQG